ncbi:putative exported protein [gamma proteobacterium IMCC2047]|nr:putative exported protein [gamma proteobacterium IMCC2047]
MQRRQFLQLAMASSALALSALSGCSSRSSKESPLLLSGADKGNEHTVSGWQLGQGERFRLTVEQRVHAPLMRPGSHDAVYVARRPGTAIYVVDVKAGQIKQQVLAEKQRHFYGHAVFSNDGRWLYVPENAYAEEGRGKLAVYDAAANYQRVQEFDLGGIGPHQLALMPDGLTLVVAMGGIQTHPDLDREKLNLATMQSALVFVDRLSGKITQRFDAPHQHLSLRHLDVAPDGTVVVGAQFQTAANPDQPYTGPLVFSQRGAEPLKAFEAQERDWLAQHHYIASVVINRVSTLALTTTPRGGRVNLWQLEQGVLLRSFPVRDVAGAGYLADQNQFVVSNGLGQLFAVSDELQLLAQAPATRWDNHLSIG